MVWDYSPPSPPPPSCQSLAEHGREAPPLGLGRLHPSAAAPAGRRPLPPPLLPLLDALGQQLGALLLVREPPRVGIDALPVRLSAVGVELLLGHRLLVLDGVPVLALKLLDVPVPARAPGVLGVVPALLEVLVVGPARLLAFYALLVRGPPQLLVHASLLGGLPLLLQMHGMLTPRPKARVGALRPELPLVAFMCPWMDPPAGAPRGEEGPPKDT
mmetsp:Transcript_17532/g.56542  ORF Transcript_17532/g.56542 Transcript_17532/m.56542 type:complete len:215 (+) Transcript_17532:723-1367(+)